MKVFVAPTHDQPDKGDGGIRRVSEALIKYLPDFGIETVPEIAGADLINNHATWLLEKRGTPMVASCHGLMWADYEWGNWAHAVNRNVRETLLHAQGWTVPSEWVRNAVVRGLAIDPAVIHHGTEIPEAVEPTADYLLWNKTRIDAVCDVSMIGALASAMPDQPIVTTFVPPGDLPGNVKVIGKMPHGDMLGVVAKAGVYLCTAEETFGIGTLEALAAGVPVVGYNYGGQAEIIRQGETGILVKPGDTAALADAIQEVLRNRPAYSAQARQDAILRWQWRDKVGQYAELFRRVYEAFHAPGPRVSLIVTYHNLSKYVADTVNSAIAQDDQDWEMILVDDGSTRPEAAAARKVAKLDDRIKYHRTPKNLKLSGARNYGLERAAGRYVLPLDADDMLAPGAIKVLADALDKDPGLGIAYGHIDLYRDDGTFMQRDSWPFPAFDWSGQMRNLNQLPYSAMVRADLFRRLGGYRDREKLAEDAAFWCLATSYGARAEKVTQAATLLYRIRADSKSHTQGGDGDWTAWYGWRHSKGTPPWGAQGDPADRRFWPVYAHTQPRVSVIIPVGPGHEQYLVDALDSLFGQTYPYWEAIVVNDTGKPWAPAGVWGSPVQGQPWAKVIETSGKEGVAAARNAGLAAARGETVAFLDADDMYLPDYLARTVPVALQSGRLIYTDWYKTNPAQKEPDRHEAPEWVAGNVLKGMKHASTIVVPRTEAIKAGGFDTGLAGWEDWGLLIALEENGVCGYHVPIPLFSYRFHSGKRREESYSQRDKVESQFRARWGRYFDGEADLMSCQTCGGGARPIPASSYPVGVQASQQGGQEFTTVEYVGPNMSITDWRGPVTGTIYSFGAIPTHQTAQVDSRDLRLFEGRSGFVIHSV